MQNDSRESLPDQYAGRARQKVSSQEEPSREKKNPRREVVVSVLIRRPLAFRCLNFKHGYSVS
jgi:hypothetical protein